MAYNLKDYPNLYKLLMYCYVDSGASGFDHLMKEYSDQILENDFEITNKEISEAENGVAFMFKNYSNYEWLELTSGRPDDDPSSEEVKRYDKITAGVPHWKTIDRILNYFY